MGLDAARAVFRAYLLTELVRSKGLAYGMLGLIVWMLFFVMPIALFAPPSMSPGTVAGYVFSAILVFMSYSMASWDWAWEIRYLLMNGILEYVLASGRSVFILYVGVVPASLIWMVLALALVYGALAVFMAPPALALHDPAALAAGTAMLLIVLFAYAMLLGGTTISTGTSGPLVELISWILPLATGGLAPLRNMPPALQAFALLTPFSYPAELIRLGLLGAEPIMDPRTMIMIGIPYSALFLALSLIYFRGQLRKMMKEGPRTIGMY